MIASCNYSCACFISFIFHWFQIDLKYVTSVDGIVLYNWFHFVETLDKNVRIRTLYVEGTAAFQIEYGVDENHLTSGKLQVKMMFFFDMHNAHPKSKIIKNRENVCFYESVLVLKFTHFLSINDCFNY